TTHAHRHICTHTHTEIHIIYTPIQTLYRHTLTHILHIMYTHTSYTQHTHTQTPYTQHTHTDTIHTHIPLCVISWVIGGVPFQEQIRAESSLTREIFPFR